MCRANLGASIKNMGFPGDAVIKNPPANAGDVGSIPGSGRFPGVGNDNPLQYSYLENFMGRRGWWATVLWVTKESDVTKHTCICIRNTPSGRFKSCLETALPIHHSAQTKHLIRKFMCPVFWNFKLHGK